MAQLFRDPSEQHGMVECCNRMVLEMLRAVSEQQEDWDRGHLYTMFFEFLAVYSIGISDLFHSGGLYVIWCP